MTHQDSRYIEFVQDVLIAIRENLRDLDERKSFAEAEELPFIEGKILAYHEMLSILRVSAEIFDLPKPDTGQ